MKKVEAIVQPNKLDVLKEGLANLGIGGMTISKVKGFGQGRGYIVRRGAEIEVDFVEKVKVEVIVKDQYVEPTVNIIIELCWTGKVGDGKIFITNIEETIRIRTNERGEDAVKIGESR